MFRKWNESSTELNRGRCPPQSTESNLSTSFRDDCRKSVEIDVDIDGKLEHEKDVLHFFPTFGVDCRISDKNFFWRRRIINVDNICVDTLVGDIVFNFRLGLNFWYFNL